ncbi:MAG: four helix bundle protein [Patescibacteria group bacterium]
MNIRTYQDLLAWQKAYELTKEIYKATSHFPKSEQFGLTSQLRRASVSISSNIAEGYHRSTKKEYRNFCYIAYGSASEVETQLRLAKDLEMVPADTLQICEDLVQTTLKLLNGLCKSLND